MADEPDRSIRPLAPALPPRPPPARWREATLIAAAASLVFGGGVMVGSSLHRAAPEVRVTVVTPPERRPEPPPPPAELWAASVRDLSSQYGTTSWAADRALGAPDVFPAGGDQVNAWASLGADDRVEHLELGLAQPARLSAADVFETYNPGAVSRVELIGASGAHHVVYAGAPRALGQPAFRRHLEFACTDEPIVAIRLTIDSPAVPGWNEIDAVGGVPCRE